MASPLLDGVSGKHERFFPRVRRRRNPGVDAEAGASRRIGHDESGVQPGPRDDHIGVALGWFDEFQMHRANGGQILLDDRFGGAVAFRDVTLQAPDKS